MRSRQPFDFLTGRWRQRMPLLVLLATVGFDLHAEAPVSVVEAADIHLQAYLQAEAGQVERLSDYLRNEMPSSCAERCDIPLLPEVAVERRLREVLAERGMAEPVLSARIGAITQAMTQGVRRSRCHALDASSHFFGSSTPEEANEAIVRFRCDLPDAAVALRQATTLREHGDNLSVDALLRTHMEAAVALRRAPLRTIDGEMLMHRDTGGAWRTMLPAQWMECFLALLEHADAPATAVPAANLSLRAHLGFTAADRQRLEDYLQSARDPAWDEPGATLADLLTSLGQDDAWDEEAPIARLTATFVTRRESSELVRLFDGIPEQRIRALSRQMVAVMKAAQCTATQVDVLPLEYSHHVRVSVRCQLPDISAAVATVQQRADAGVPVTREDVDALIAALASPVRHARTSSLGLALIGVRGDTWYVHPNKIFDMGLTMLFSAGQDAP